MEISKGIRIIDKALWIEQAKTLIVNDLHLGYEEELHRRGILVPRYQLEETIQHLQKIFQEVKPRTIVINGDLKQEFSETPNQEWKEILFFLDFLRDNCSKIVIIKGNHDPIIKPVAERRKIKVVSEYQIGDILIVHGHKLVKTEAKKIIIGHEHPAITLREHGKYEKYKCFLKGKWQTKEIIVIPSFNPLLEGTDVLKEKLLSPFLTDLKKFSVYIVSEGKTYNFGKIERFVFV